MRINIGGLLASVFVQRNAAEWVERLQVAGIPSSLVRNFDEVAKDPQCKLREMFPLMQHAVAGPHRVINGARLLPGAAIRQGR